jgi:hypothetical protein
MDPAKLEALLLKIRKGATASLTAKNLSEAFAVLDPGWKLEKTTGLVKLYGRSEENHPEAFFDDDRDKVEQKQKDLSKDAVTSLPSSPKANKLYVLDLTEVKQANPTSRNFNDSRFYFEFKPWMGSEGWKVTTSTGRTQDFFPSRHVFGTPYHGYKPGRLGQVYVFDIITWLNKETDWLDQINKKLGLDTFEKSAPRTRESTGSCPVCFQNIKIKDGRMVLHGYRRPGHGSTVGNCFGVGYPPFELDVKGTKAFLEEDLVPKYESAKKGNDLAEADKIDSIPKKNGEIRRGDFRWDYELRSYKMYLKQKLEVAEETKKAFEKLVANWKERPLPKKGDPHIDWFFKGQKA